MGLYGGMGREHLFHGLLKGLGRYFSGEGPYHGNVVDGFLRGFHALQEHAGLLVSQGLRFQRAVIGGLTGRTLSRHPEFENLVFYALEAGGLGKGVHIGLDAVALEQLGSQAQTAQGAEAVEHQGFGESRPLDAGGFLEQGRQFFLQEVERGGRLVFGLLGLRLGQGLHIHLLIHVQGDGVYLHGDRRHHIRWLAFQDKGVESGRINGFVTHNISSHELAATFLVKGLHGHVLDAREFADDGLHFLEFDAEAADLHLRIFSADVFDIAVGPVAHDVAGVVHAAEGGMGLERIFGEGFGGFVGTAQIAVSYLETRLQQFSGMPMAMFSSCFFTSLETT